jgi:iron complex transport system ATP-binding protein
MERRPDNNYMLTKGLSVGYEEASPLLDGLNLQLGRGELVCFMGANGVGKSTLIRTLAGLQKPMKGSIIFPMKDPDTALPKHLSVVLTDKVTAVNMTVFDVVAFGRYPYLNWKVKLTTMDQDVIDRALQVTRIEHLRDRRLHELSDGQVQMVMIARAIIQDTPIIFLDEPTAHLDLNNRLEIMNLLRSLAHDNQKAILASTHELDLALQTADTIWLASSERQIITGVPEDLVLNGTFDKVFQWKGFDLRTGKIRHEAYRNITVKLVGEGYAYLWSKNALERNGFSIVSDDDAFYEVTILQKQQQLQWTLNGSEQFSSIQNLLCRMN